MALSREVSGNDDAVMTTPDATLDHQGLEVLRPDECWSLTGSVPVGRVAFVSDGEPMVLPVNHRVVGHHVVFRTARGALLHEALMDRPVAFEADGWDETHRTGWSVVIRGQASAVDMSGADALALDAWADSVERDDWVRITPTEVSGRRIVR